jgi:hypothetical protein
VLPDVELTAGRRATNGQRRSAKRGGCPELGTGRSPSSVYFRNAVVTVAGSTSATDLPHYPQHFCTEGFREVRPRVDDFRQRGVDEPGFEPKCSAGSCAIRRLVKSAILSRRFESSVAHSFFKSLQSSESSMRRLELRSTQSHLHGYERPEMSDRNMEPEASQGFCYVINRPNQRVVPGQKPILGDRFERTGRKVRDERWHKSRTRLCCVHATRSRT